MSLLIVQVLDVGVVVRTLTRAAQVIGLIGLKTPHHPVQNHLAVTVVSVRSELCNAVHVLSFAHKTSIAHPEVRYKACLTS